jgi:hypothetical protein
MSTAPFDPSKGIGKPPLARKEERARAASKAVTKAMAATTDVFTKAPDSKEVSDVMDNLIKAYETEKKVSEEKVKSMPPLGVGFGTKGGKTRRNTTTGGDIVTHLLTIRNQIKLYHWQTREFARHKATDDLTAAIDVSIDNFVESYMGRYGRPKVSGSIKLHNFSENAAKSFVAREAKYLERELPRKIKKSDSDLLGIRDEILAELTKVSYLLTLT